MPTRTPHTFLIAGQYLEITELASVLSVFFMFGGHLGFWRDLLTYNTLSCRAAGVQHDVQLRLCCQPQTSGE